MRTLKVVGFGGLADWPVAVAAQEGSFARRGLAVDLSMTPDSKFVMLGLIDGSIDIALVAIDNIIAYREG